MLISIFTFVSECLTVKKSGNPWWGLLIPFYSTYVLCKMGKKPKLFWVYLPIEILLGAVYSVFSFIYVQTLSFAFYSAAVGQNISDDIADYLTELLDGNMLALLAVLAVALVVSIASLIISVILCISIAKAFGRSGWFGVGLLFVPVVFWAILAFDSTIEYVRDDLPVDEDGYYTTE